MTAGNIGKWKKNIGDQVVPGDVLMEIETDKAIMDFELQEEGYLAKTFVKTGDKDVPVNTLLAILAENKNDVPAFADFTDASAPAASAAPTSPPPQLPSPPQTSVAPTPTTPSQAAPVAPASGARKFASPLARKLASEMGIPLDAIQGSGPGGRVVKVDVLSYKPIETPKAAAPTPAPAPAPATTTLAADFTDLPASKIRQIIAERLTESKQTIPHFYLTVEINMEKILGLRTAFNAKSDKFKLSVNDFIIKASSLALQKVPEVNSSWMGSFIRQYHQSDISVAVATEKGLFTPIIFDAQSKGLVKISDEMKQLAAKAKDNKLMPHEYQGGSFSISNLGMFGIKHFTAIINPPQACILAVGASEKRLVANEAAPNGYETATIMTVTLSCDHRVVDGAVGAQWLKVFKSYMEDPITMLL